MFLVTNKLIANLSCSEDFIYLGPWSVPEDKDLITAYDRGEIMENSWDDREQFQQGAFYTFETYKKMLLRIVCHLDTHLNMQFDILYWKILIGFWLMHYINIFYDRYVLIKEAIKRYPDIRTAILDKTCFITPRTTEEYFYISGDLFCDYYNLQLFSLIFPELSKNFQIVNIPYQLEIPEKTFSRKCKKFIAQTISYVSKRKTTILVHGQIPPSSILKMIGIGFGKIGYLRRDFKLKNIPLPDYESDLRIGFDTIKHDNFFEKILIRSLKYSFPVIYLEKFNAARHAVLEYMNGKPPCVFCSVGGFLQDEFGRFFAAESANMGSKFINMQHGGNYGINYFHQYEAYEISISDKFWCWGWAGLENDTHKLENAPSLKLSSSIRRNSRRNFLKNDILLFIGTSHPRYLYRFWNFPVGTQWIEYLKNQIEFIQTVDKNIFGKIVYRSGAVEHGWKFSEKMKRYFPELVIDNFKYSFIKQMRRSRLAVIDHNATTYLETLAANQPTIIYFDPNLFEIRDSVADYFDMLKSAEILFDTPGDAANHASRIYHNVDKWWFSEKVQQSRLSFVKHFALTASNSRKIFTKMLIKELKDPVDNEMRITL